MENKKYIAPFDLFGGEIPKGTIYGSIGNDYKYIPLLKNLPNKVRAYSITGEIVEKWEEYKENPH